MIGYSTGRVSSKSGMSSSSISMTSTLLMTFPLVSLMVLTVVLAPKFFPVLSSLLSSLISLMSDISPEMSLQQLSLHHPTSSYIILHHPSSSFIIHHHPSSSFLHFATFKLFSLFLKASLIHSFMGHPVLFKVSMGIIFYLIQIAVVGLLTYGRMNIEQIHTPIYIRDKSALIEIFE